MKKRKKDTWVTATVTAIIADVIAQNSPRNTLARKHAGTIALRYALRSEAIYRANQIKKWLVISGVVGLIILLIVIGSSWSL